MFSPVRPPRHRSNYLHVNRDEVRQIVERGLAEAGGSYKRALRAFGLPEAEYLKFMDFLRHHRLKPERYRRNAA